MFLIAQNKHNVLFERYTLVMAEMNRQHYVSPDNISHLLRLLVQFAALYC